jgi:hypothetical protein
MVFGCKNSADRTIKKCNVPIFGFPCSAVGDDFQGLCQPRQKGEVMLSVSLEDLVELYEGQPSPFTIFHHRDHFRTVCSCFRGISTIPVI